MYTQVIDAAASRIHKSTLLDTIHQVSDQLVIISKLRRQNDQFLSNSERDWIDNVVLSAKTVIEKLRIEDSLVVDKDEPPRSKRLKTSAFIQQVKSAIQSSPKATQNLTQLLIVAQTLNSATSLLSCCYERHKWTTRQIQSIPLVEEDFHTDLAHLLDRRRDRRRGPVNQLVRNASVCLRDPPPAPVEALENHVEKAPSAPPKPESSASSSINVDRTEPESMLSLIIAESIDNWKRNAEIALELAVQNSPPSDASDRESCNMSIRTTSQCNVSDIVCAVLPASEHPAHQEPPAIDQSPMSESGHPPVVENTHSRQKNMSIRRKEVASRSTSTTSPAPQITADFSHSDKPLTTSTGLIYLPVRGNSHTAGKGQTSDERSVASSRSSGLSTHTFDGGTAEIARVVILPKASPRFEQVTASSQTRTRSDIAALPAASTSPRQKRVSRGRAWLERQIEAPV